MQQRKKLPIAKPIEEDEEIVIDDEIISRLEDLQVTEASEMKKKVSFSNERSEIDYLRDEIVYMRSSVRQLKKNQNRLIEIVRLLITKMKTEQQPKTPFQIKKPIMVFKK